MDAEISSQDCDKSLGRVNLIRVEHIWIVVSI